MTHSVPRDKHAAAGLALDPTVPNPARIWNYWVGGKDHFEADRALAEQFGQVVPNMPLIARLARTADSRQHARSRPAHRTGVSYRLRGQRSGRARPRPRAADQ
jgi:hypothetical protein